MKVVQEKNISGGSNPSLSGASLEFVMDQFKHGSMQTTMNYVDSIDDSKRKDMTKLL